MGSLRFGSIQFVAYPQDHNPRHVHGFSESVELVLDRLEDGSVVLANRKDAITPTDAKRSTVRKILSAAAAHFDELLRLWEEAHEG